MNMTSTPQTDTHQYLLPSSCHPPQICKNIPYSQAIHLRRIFCSSDTLFQSCSTELANHLKNRKYKDKIVSAQISKLPQSPANRLLNIRRKINSAGSLLSRLIILISPVLATLFVGTCLFSSACVSSSEESQRPCFCTPETTYLQ